jgi:VanZ family protein
MLQRSPTTKRWPLFLLIGYICLLLWGTHAPTEPIPALFNLQDKLVHFGAYGVLAFLVFLAATTRNWFPEGAASSVLGSALIVILATATFGAADELTQYFVPGRIVDAVDWVANLTGCVAGAAVFGGLLAWKRI